MPSVSLATLVSHLDEDTAHHVPSPCAGCSDFLLTGNYTWSWPPILKLQ